MKQTSSSFPIHSDFQPAIQARCVTARLGRCIHRFFDTSPFSPTGRYLAAFRLPFEHRMPQPGEEGEVVVVDLSSGEQETVARTRGWEPQMGANLQWGSDDRTLLFNDIDPQDWRPHAVKLDWPSGERSSMGAGVYHVSPDGRYALASCPLRMARTQFGYGVPAPESRIPRNLGAREDDGIHLLDTATGSSRLLISIAHALESAFGPSGMDAFRDQEVYAFHSKWSPSGERFLFTLRSYPASHPKRFNVISDQVIDYYVFTASRDGGDIRLAVPPEQWRKGGHHINWFPSGDKLSMNLDLHGDGLRFVQCAYDGSDLREIIPNALGSGHPTVLPGEQLLLTDVYATEPLAFPDGTTPIRLLRIPTGEERQLLRIPTRTEHQDRIGALRIDPHPAWERGYRRFAFNAHYQGARAVYVAEADPRTLEALFAGAH